MADNVFRVNGRDYPVPTDLTLGEMCDAERFFGVEFGSQATSGVRMAAALLWVAIRREDPSVTVEDIRELPPSVFEALSGDDAGPPASDAGTNADSGTSGDNSSSASDGQEAVPQATGIPA